jgi:hypothetical protein
MAVTFFILFPIMCLEQSPEESFIQGMEQHYKQHLSYLCEFYNCCKIPCMATSENLAGPLCFPAWDSWAQTYHVP